jgi:hypothetical protein
MGANNQLFGIPEERSILLRNIRGIRLLSPNRGRLWIT